MRFSSHLNIGRIRRRPVLPGLLLSLLIPATAGGDQIAVGDRNYAAARIVGLHQGRLRFQVADGSLQTAWLDEVSLIVVDRGVVFADFNQAERFRAAGEPDKAIARYQRSMRLTDDFWKDIVAARLILAADAAGELDQAVHQFIRLTQGAHGGPWAAARHLPTRVPARRNARVVSAIEQLDTALQREATSAERALFALLRYEIMRRAGDARTDAEAERLAGLTIPPAVGTERVYVILLDALERGMQGRTTPQLRDGLDRAIHNTPESLLPGFLLLKGRVGLREADSREALIRATWPLLRVAIHFPDDPRAGRGLYEAGSILERLGLAEQAVSLWRECLTLSALDDQTRRDATAALKRLQP